MASLQSLVKTGSEKINEEVREKSQELLTIMNDFVEMLKNNVK